MQLALPGVGTFVPGSWTIGNLANGASATLSIYAKVNTDTVVTTISNTATVSADQSDNNTDNNTATATLTVAQPSTDLSLTKTADQTNPAEGDIVKFTLKVTNNGNVADTNVAVNDLVPGGLTTLMAIPTQGSYVAGTGIWSVGTLNAGASATLTIYTKVNAGTAGSTIVNSATATGDLTDSNPANNTASASVTVKNPTASVDLSLTKTVDKTAPSEGDTVLFTVTVTNNSTNTTATNVNVSDLVPTGLKIVAAIPNAGGTYCGNAACGPLNLAAGQWSVGSLAPGASASLKIYTKVNGGTACQAITNTASLLTLDQADPNAANNSASASISVQGEDCGGNNNGGGGGNSSVNLSLTKTADNSSPNVGSTVHFTITVANESSSTAATNVAVNDVLPAGLIYVSSTASSGSYNANSGIWSVSTLAPQATSTLAITTTIDGDAACQAVTNTANVTADQSNVGDESASATVKVAGSGCGGGGGDSGADLSITKTADVSSATLNDTINYTLTVTNNGPQDATRVVASDTLPSDLTFVSANPGVGSFDSSTGLWTIGNLASGSSTTLTLAAKVNSGDPGDKIANTATVSGSQADSNAGNNSSTVKVNYNNSIHADISNGGGGGGGGGFLFNLIITKTGLGTGTVTSMDGNINCGQNCSASYPSGSQVTLSATPGSNSSFTGTWSGGGCSGDGSCVVTMTGNTAVNAHFSSKTNGNSGGNNNPKFAALILGDFTDTPSNATGSPGQVLGARTSLPRTGEDLPTLLLLVLIGLVVVDRKYKLI